MGDQVIVTAIRSFQIYDQNQSRTFEMIQFLDRLPFLKNTFEEIDF